MLHEASLSKTWRNRQLLIAAFLTGFALWFFYDGAIAYPAKNIQFDEFQRLKGKGRAGEWEAVAGPKGWPRKPPEHAFEPDQITGQYLLGSVSLAGGIAALALLGVSARRKLQSDHEAVFASDGSRVPIASITSLNKKKWDSKGIAIAYYEEGGKKRKLVIDDYKYAGGEAILKQVEEALSSRAG